MTGGKSFGENREYQVLAQKLVEKMDPERYEPFCGDGVDVPIQTGGTTWSVDVVLRERSSGNLLLIECKRHADDVAQSYAGAFAWIVSSLRTDLKAKYPEDTRPDVVAWFFVKSGVQAGAQRVADFAGFSVVEALDGQTEDAIAASFVERRLDGGLTRHHCVFLADTSTMDDSVLTETSR